MRNTCEPTSVLLVVDHEDVAWGLRKLIDGEWPRMIVSGTARSLAEAFAATDRRKPGVIILDLFVGAENSLDHLADLTKMSGAKVLVLADRNENDLRRRAMALGAYAVVLKDASADILLREIESARRKVRHAAQ